MCKNANICYEINSDFFIQSLHFATTQNSVHTIIYIHTCTSVPIHGESETDSVS